MKDRISFRSALIAMFALLLIGSTALGQVARQSLSGNIKDPTDAAVSGAKVVAKHIATNEEFQTTTNSQGAFTFASLPLGQFSVSIEATGFKRVEAQEVTLELGTPARLNVAMEVGQLSEAIVVTGTQEVVNTTNPTLTNVVRTNQIKDLPLPTRNVLDLARLQAGVAVTGTDTRNGSVGGLRGTGTYVTQDGINAMDNFVKTSSFFAISAPSLDSVQEFSLTVGTVGSDAGRGVAQVTMVTKNGTNEYHGRVFYQHRNDALNANTFFNNATATPRETLRQHFAGGNIGGPVIVPKIYNGRDKSFFFFSYEAFREKFQATRNRTVLTDAARQGLFSYVGSDGSTQTLNLLAIGNDATGATRPANPVTLAQLNSMPASNNNLVGDGLNTGGFRFNVSGTDPNDKYVGRFDQQLFESSKYGTHKLEFIYNHADFLLTPDTFNGLEAPFAGGVNAFQSSQRILTTAAIQSAFGSRVTNEVRVGHQRAPVGFLRQGNPTTFFINLGSVSDFDNTFLSQGRNTLVYQFIDNLSLISGPHNFRMGVDFQSISAITFNDAGTNQTINMGSNNANGDGILAGEFPLLPAGATGTALVNRAKAIYADLTGLLGSTAKTFNVTSPTSGFVPGATRQRDFKQRALSLYFQDQWRARRNFTLNYGVRWEFQGVPYETNGLAIQPVNGVGGLFGISGANNLFKPGTLTGTSPVALQFVNGDTGRKLYGNDWNNFAPFIGVAYSPDFESGPMKWLFGSSGKGSIRAGFSISYLQDGFTVVSNALGVGTTNPGLIQNVGNNTPTGVLSAAGFALPTPVFTDQINDAGNLLLNTDNGLWTFDPNLRTPYVQQFSFGIEREIATNTAFEVRYVGNRAVKLFRAIDINEVNIFENGFLQEFINAQSNLALNGGLSFDPGAAGAPLPIFSALFAGLPASVGFGSTTFITQLNNNNIGAMAFNLANSATYRTNRGNLTPNFFLANPNANFARALQNGGFSSYHSLQAEIRRRMTKGLQLQASYTLAKALTDTDGGGQSTLEQYRTFRNLSLDKHRAGFDQKHRFIGNFIYELPFGTGRRFLNGGIPVLNKVIEGWQVGSIISYQTGGPIGIFAGRSTFNQFNTGLNPALLVGISSDQFRDAAGIFKTPAGVFFFDPNLLNITTNAQGRLTGATLKNGLLAAPAPGTFGNFPRNMIDSPNFSQVDISVSKLTRFYEKANVEFKANFINAFNTPNFAFGSINFDDANFGRINTQRGSERQINFILGINF